MGVFAHAHREAEQDIKRIACSVCLAMPYAPAKCLNKGGNLCATIGFDV
jgi:hypothetical protein